MASIATLRWMSLGSVLFWLVVYWQGGKKALIDIKESIRAKTSRFDTALLIIISLCSLVIIASAFLTSFGLLEAFLMQSLLVTFMGALLTMLGVAGMFYCRHYLGKFWTAETNLVGNHRIIDTGPYRFVRHPIYTFAIIMYIGFCLVFLSHSSVLFTGLIITAYVLKTKDEDIFLEKSLSGYREYKLRVRYYLVPRLW
jgi:protein-S-isoprenylcysteine O-methyltransferase Ste14